MSSEASAENQKNDKNEAITGKLAKNHEKFMKNGSTISHKSYCRARVPLAESDQLYAMLLVLIHIYLRKLDFSVRN